MYDHLWGLNSKHRHDVQQNNAELIKNKLARLKVKRCDCSSWMQELVADYSHEPRVEGEYSTHVSNEKLIVFWLKKLFAELQTLVNQFNANLVEDYMFIEATEPEFHTVACTEAPAPGKSGKEIYFEAHFVSRTAALLLRGFDHEIDVFIVPADVWLGLSLNTIDQKDYPPILKLNLLSKEEAEPILSESGLRAGDGIAKAGISVSKASMNLAGSLLNPATQTASTNKEAAALQSIDRSINGSIDASPNTNHIDPEHINDLARMLFKELIKASLR